MPMFDIDLTGDGGFKDIEHLAEFQMGERKMRALYLSGGMQSGKPSVAFAIQKDDGTWFVFETSASALANMTGAIVGAARREGFELWAPQQVDG